MDPDAWNDGLRPATWRRQGSTSVDTSGLHELLRQAQLPRAELLHMGATPRLLSDTAPATWPQRPAIALLGRIALDAEFDASGYHWTGDRAQHAIAVARGATIVVRRFVP